MTGPVTPTRAPDRDVSSRQHTLARRVRLLVALTISYNVVEAVVALLVGTQVSSGALVAFGLDSVIEVSSAAAVAWQFSAPTHAQRQAREAVALRVISVSFSVLGAYVAVQSVMSLLGGEAAEHSAVGLVLAASSLVIMPMLSAFQRRAGRELGSRTAVADSKQTLLCTYLSAVLLVGLAMNSLFGWSWADPVAALVIAVVAIREGRQAWRADSCCAPGLPDLSGHPRAAGETTTLPSGPAVAAGTASSLWRADDRREGSRGYLARPQDCCGQPAACGPPAAGQALAPKMTGGS